MVAFTPVENCTHFGKPINVITPDPMQFFKELKNLSVPDKRTIPICITAAVYRLSAGNSFSSSFDRRQPSDPLPANTFWTSHSPWDTYRHLYLMRKADEYTSSSCSSSSSSSSSSSLGGSTCSSSRSESPEPSCPTTLSSFDHSGNSRCSHSNDNDDDNDNTTKKHHHHHHHHNKKRSRHMLLREIRRLRGENHSLRTTVSVLKNDLRDINLSRQYTDASHKKFYDEYIDKNTQLEIDIMDRDDEIKKLKEEVIRLKTALEMQQQKHQRQLQGLLKNKTTEPAISPSSALSTAATTLTADAGLSVNNEFACFDYFEKEDDDVLSCQPIASSHDSVIPDMVIDASASQCEKDEQEEINAYFRRRMMDMQNEDYFDDDNDYDAMDTNGCNNGEADNEDEPDEEDHEVEPEPFETLAPSYIHQAILSKLSSTRVRLEFDELILKYEPTPDMITHVLAVSFAQWMCATLSKNIDKDAVPPITPAKVFGTKIQSGIVGFWQAVLQFYTSEEESQLLFLNHLDNAVNDKLTIVDNFDRLVFMLYKYNVIDDDASLNWWHHPFDNEGSRKIRTVTHKFAEWLEEDEDEGNDDECCRDSDSEDEEEEEEEESADTTQHINEHDTNNDQVNDLIDSDDQYSLQITDEEADSDDEPCCTNGILHEEEDLKEKQFGFDDESWDDEEEEVPVVKKKKYVKFAYSRY